MIAAESGAFPEYPFISEPESVADRPRRRHQGGALRAPRGAVSDGSRKRSRVGRAASGRVPRGVRPLIAESSEAPLP
jgi:hypothetical protein